MPGGIPSSRKARRSLKTQQHAHQAVFHTGRLMCVQVRPWPQGQARNQAVQQYPVEAPGLASVYWRPLVVAHRQVNSFVREFFTESLILAQDERWRRA